MTSQLVGEEKAPGNILMPDEVRTLVRELQESGEVELEERDLVDALLESGSTEVVSIMVPRTRMAFVSEEASLAAARDLMTARRQQRIAVYAGHHDNLRGLIFAEDLMALALAGEDLEARSVVEMLQPVPVVPPTKCLDEMLEYFLSNQRLAAVVLNEFGGVEGMVTIRHLVDFVFDPICGLTPTPESFAGPEPGVFDVPGDMKLSVFDDLTNLGISDPRMTTVAGVIFRHLDRLPVVGDRVVVEGTCFEVLKMAEHRIEQVRARRDGGDTAEVAR
jgi:CBS domain containing-hemolysin-like protein